jgi:hypothetical protein
MSPSAPAPQASASGAAMASSTGKQPSETPTELQRGADSFMGLAELLAGGEPEPEPKSAPKPTAKPAAPETPAKPEAKESKDPGAQADPEDDPAEKPILGDDDAPETDDDDGEDGADGGKSDADLQAKLFKQRQKRRDAEKLAADTAAELAKLKKENEELRTQPPAAQAERSVLGGPFAQAKTETDLTSLEDIWSEWIEDLSDKKDGFIDDNGTEYTPEQVRHRIAELRSWKRAVPAARKVLSDHADHVRKSEEIQKEASAKASKLYPFVSNAGKKHNDLALSLAQEFPEINASPARSLLLGMLTTARLVERGDFTVVPKLKSNADPAAAAAPEKKASPMPPPAPAPPPRQQTPVPDTSNHVHARIIAGDMAAVEDWAMGLVGND